MKQGFQLRDVFNPEVVNQLAQSIGNTWPEFDQTGLFDVPERAEDDTLFF